MLVRVPVSDRVAAIRESTFQTRDSRYKMRELTLCPPPLCTRARVSLCAHLLCICDDRVVMFAHAGPLLYARARTCAIVRVFVCACACACVCLTALLTLEGF